MNDRSGRCIAELFHGQRFFVAHFHTMGHWLRNRNRARYARRTLAFTGLLLFAGSTQASTSFAERRGLWVVAYDLTSPQRIDAMVQSARSWGITDLLVQVRSRGDAYYRTNLAPPADALHSSPNFDPLAYVLQKASGARLRVHAWMNVYLLWSNPRAPRDRSHPVIRNSSWISQTAHAPRLQTGMDIVRHSQQQNLEGAYLSPGHPAARNYLVEVITEVARNYPIDGLHLDYIRYPGENYGFEEPMSRAFQRRFGVTPTNLIYQPQHTMRRFGETRYAELLAEWEQFRCDQITALVRAVYRISKQANPALIVSMAVRPDVVQARSRYGQDWARWAQDGVLDMVLPMNYTPEDALFASRTQTILTYIPKQKVWMGVSTFNQNARQVAAKVQHLRILGLHDYVLFSYQSMRTQPQLPPLLR